ncbi:MAG: carboxypeptidase regulatory-like domain-containing protein, partial [Opitutaceae bacterium]
MLRSSFLIAILFLGAVASRLPAAAPATGGIAGRVLNVGTGQYLTNARVSVRGTTTAAFTDKDGSYRLAGLPAGAVMLEVFFTDLDVATAEVVVPAGGTVQLDFNLSSVARYGL